MTPKEKATELIEKLMPYMYCYMGSGMLSNDYDERVALDFAKTCTNICVDEIIASGPGDVVLGDDLLSGLTYWTRVKEEIVKYEAQ